MQTNLANTIRAELDNIRREVPNNQPPNHGHLLNFNPNRDRETEPVRQIPNHVPFNIPASNSARSSGCGRFSNEHSGGNVPGRRENSVYSQPPRSHIPPHLHNSPNPPNHVPHPPLPNSYVASPTQMDMNLKYASLMRNWNLLFDGNTQGISVEEFIYRTETLTRQTLNNNFDLLCNNIHVLFTGHAAKWFWRYHRRYRQINWQQFCHELRAQFQDRSTDSDIIEMIRDRKQRAGECFDAFYEGVRDLCDRLVRPIPDAELLIILRKNLRDEIRKDMLYVPIFSIEHLRHLSREKENLLRDFHYKTRGNFPNQLIKPKHISEIDLTESSAITERNLYVEAVGGSRVVTKQKPTFCCWNCKVEGHRFTECLEPPRLFCWGCGKDDVYTAQTARNAIRETLDRAPAHHQARARKIRATSARHPGDLYFKTTV